MSVFEIEQKNIVTKVTHCRICNKNPDPKTKTEYLSYLHHFFETQIFNSNNKSIIYMAEYLLYMEPYMMQIYVEY